jgi:hypothetical protein
LYGKLSKCPFFQSEVKYLGHVTNKEGIAVDSEKIETLINWLAPRNAKDLRSFMGLAGYSINFVEGFSQIANPITSLQKKVIKLKWTQEY